VDTFHILLAEDNILLVNDATIHLQRFHDLALTLIKYHRHILLLYCSRKIHSIFPWKWDSLLATGSMLFYENDKTFEDTSVKYCDGLPMKERSITLHNMRIVFAVEVILPLHKHLIR